jgi:hypothetical protein
MRMPKRLLAIAAACLAALASAAGAASDGHIRGWITEPGVEPPSYAVTEPTDNMLNVDTVVLLCTEVAGRRSLELDLYLTDEGPLLPRGANPQALKEDPRVEIAIDGHVFPAELLFADDYVVVADATEGRDLRVPSLSRGLLDAMQRGEKMTLRFDLLARPKGEPARFDSELTVDLVSGRSAIAGVRRCAAPRAQHQVAG